jgi:hypothetical protein
VVRRRCLPTQQGTTQARDVLAIFRLVRDLLRAGSAGVTAELLLRGATVFLLLPCNDKAML